VGFQREGGRRAEALEFCGRDEVVFMRDSIWFLGLRHGLKYLGEVSIDCGVRKCCFDDS